ncbi:hypothetical protein EVAR_39753_1 [Eumeta japonica]|uniref:Uncharacterized protein n=1 Tax=Eumeta variegata TaxID=151549 RepID=A0A4C1X6Y6_EUMVA|nr:hypothetical protein EVAR_39753_1 [Eumeta japonica]
MRVVYLLRPARAFATSNVQYSNARGREKKREKERPTVTQEKREESMKSAFPTDAYLLEAYSKIRTGAYVKLAMCKITKPEGLWCDTMSESMSKILRLFEEDGTRSIRNVASLLEISIWKVWKVLRQNNKHVFHYTPVQGLEDNDFGNRVRFCRFLLHADVDDPDFLKSILWTDESKFTKQGILNLHNLHHWSSKDENPRVKRQRSFQRRFSLNVWAGVIGDCIIGPTTT